MHKISRQIINCFKRGSKVIIFGNGGSLADASHFAAEFNRIGTVIALNDPVKITSIGNDYGFDTIFERQIIGLCGDGDLLIGLSSSGKSDNVNRALRYGEEFLNIIDFPRKGKTTQEVQEYQYHLLHKIYIEVKEHYENS